MHRAEQRNGSRHAPSPPTPPPAPLSRIARTIFGMRRTEPYTPPGSGDTRGATHASPDYSFQSRDRSPTTSAWKDGREVSSALAFCSSPPSTKGYPPGGLPRVLHGMRGEGRRAGALSPSSARVHPARERGRRGAGPRLDQGLVETRRRALSLALEDDLAAMRDLAPVSGRLGNPCPRPRG